MKAINNEDFEIIPASQQLTDTGEWTLRVLIKKHHDYQDITNHQFFDGKNTFPSKVEADAHSIEFGKRIINGEQPGLNITDL